LPQDKKNIAELKKQRLTKGKDTVMIVERPGGLVCIPKGTLLSTGRYQPVSQVIFRIGDGLVYVLNKHSRREMLVGFIDWEKDEDGQDYIKVIIPITKLSF
jgi:hypothetical protein